MKQNKRKQRLADIRSSRNKANDQQRRVIYNAVSSQGVGDVDLVLKWAFGADFGIIPMGTWPSRWNTRRGKLFRIDKRDDIIEVFKRIGAAYRHFVVDPFYKRLKEGNNGT